MYILPNNALNKYIEIDNVKIPNAKQSKIILNEIKLAIIKGIDGEKFYGSNMQVELNGKLKKLYKSTLTINKNNVTDIINKIEQSLKNNNKFINTIAEINNKSEDKIKKDIINYMMEVKTKLKESEEITINLYTNGPLSEFVKLEINQIIAGHTNKFTLTKNSETKYNINTDNKDKNQKIQMDINKNENKTKLKGAIITDVTTNINSEITENKTKIKEVNTKDIKETIKFNELTDEQKINLILGTFLGLIPNDRVALSKSSF